MKNKKLTVALADLNAGTIKTLDAVMEVSETNPYGVNKTYLRPRRIQIKNDTGKDIEFNFLANDKELADYTADPSNYAFIPLLNGEKLTISEFYPLPTPYKILVKGVGIGVATKDLTIVCIAYF